MSWALFWTMEFNRHLPIKQKEKKAVLMELRLGGSGTVIGM